MGNHPSLEEYTQKRAHVDWSGKHKEVPYTISFWNYDARRLSGEAPRGVWNFYLILSEQQWPDFERFVAPRVNDPERETRGRRMWKYHEGAAADLDWHCGITFYEIEGDAPYRWIKAGCDYDHLWDERNGYDADLRSVESDAKRCVNSLLDRFTPLVKCRYTGLFGKPEEMIPTAKFPGSFVLATEKENIWPEWFEEARDAAE